MGDETNYIYQADKIQMSSDRLTRTEESFSATRPTNVKVQHC